MTLRTAHLISERHFFGIHLALAGHIIMQMSAGAGTKFFKRGTEHEIEIET